jgi:hypothetical protein
MAGKTDCKVSGGRKAIGLTEARSTAPFASDRRGGGRYECMADRLETGGAGKLISDRYVNPCVSLV